VAGELLVQYRASATETQKAAARGVIGASVRETVRAAAQGDLELVALPPGLEVAAAVGALERNPQVAFAEPNWLYAHQATANDPYYTGGNLWGMYGDASPSKTNPYGSQAGEAWAAGYTGSSSVYVGVIDEGIQFDHPDLQGQVWTNPYDPPNGIDDDGNGYIHDLHGWDFDGGNNTIYDGTADDHGTHVAGTIGGAANNGGVVGVNWNVKLISAKFLGRSGGTTANAIRAVDYLTDLKTRKGINLVASNNSWGGGGFSTALSDAITRANTAGLLFIAAAGNGDKRGRGIDNDASPQYPASYPQANVISVAAIDSAGAKAPWSNFGATTVDLGAPGVGIWSSVAFNGYDSYSGTSMATPHVSGAAALYASSHAGATAAQIKSAILSSAIPTSSMAGRTVTGGRLNAGGF